jgi:hypothetical protein
MAEQHIRAAAAATAAAEEAKKVAEEAARKQAKTRPLPKTVDEQSDYEIQHGLPTPGAMGVKYACIADTE